MTADVLLADIVKSRDLSEVEARALVDGMRADVADLGERIVTAYIGRAWIALRYPSWDELCDVEFGGARLRIPREQRAEQVQSLRSAGLSTRAIGSALGVSDGTVRTDLGTGAQNYAPAPAPVVGQDGKTYAPTQPRRRDNSVQRDLVDEGQRLLAADRARASQTSPAPELVEAVEVAPPAPLTDAGEPDLTGVAMTREEFLARPQYDPEIVPAPPLDLSEQEWAEAAERHTEDGTVAQINRERPYSLAVLALAEAAKSINAQRDPAELGRNVPAVNAYRLADIADAHRYLAVFLNAAGRLENAS
jgi:hypothetical protein